MKDGKDCKLNNDVERVLKEFHRSRKPIGYVCCDPSAVIRLTDFELESMLNRKLSSRLPLTSTSCLN